MSVKGGEMEIDVSGVVLADDGALGDDERTETERSPKEKAPVPGEVQAIPMDSGSPPSDPGGDLMLMKEPRPRAESGASSKKKHRRGKHKGGRRHRHWKPYTKMTWEEKKELEDRETRRACKKREDRFASGQPMAPYNTTQFLMEQHQPSDVNLEESRPRLNKSEGGDQGGGSGGASGSADGSSEEYYSSPDDEEIFLEKEFTEAYENYHAERLQTMTKDELVREYLELESRVELMEKRSKQDPLNGSVNVMPRSVPSAADTILTENGQESVSFTNDKVTTSPKKKPQPMEEAAISALQEEINKLRQDNEKLRQENEQLRRTQETNSVNEGEP